MLFDPEEVAVIDTLGHISVEGESRTERIASYFDMTEKEAARQT